MRIMRQYISLILTICLFISCENKKAELNIEVPSDSIFNLSSEWHNQNNEVLYLKDLKGKTLVVVMIYTSCKASCPILIAKMKTIEQALDKKLLDHVSLVLVSIDPATDTPQHLKEFAITNNMDAAHWIFLTSNEANTQEFANVLSMKYKKISPVDFSHSNIISVFNPAGELVSQEQGTVIDVENVVATVTETVKKL